MQSTAAEGAQSRSPDPGRMSRAGRLKGSGEVAGLQKRFLYHQGVELADFGVGQKGTEVGNPESDFAYGELTDPDVA